MRSELRLIGVLSAVAVMALAPTEAHAFCRTLTVAPPADFTPTREDGCFDQGVPLFHRSQCIPYHLLQQQSAVLPMPALSEALARAFSSWTSSNATCTPGITGIELAPVNDPVIASYTKGQPGHNVFGVVQGPWPHPGSEDSLALTTLTFDANNGEIFDVDMEIREDEKWSFSEVPPPDGIDLLAAMTHEVGHVLGFAHSSNSDAVMNPVYEPGSTKQRKLAPDDVALICAVYEDRETRTVLDARVAATPCDLAPSSGAGGSTCGAPLLTHGCGVGRVGSTSESFGAGWLVVVGGAFATAALARRAARRHAQGSRSRCKTTLPTSG
jgi:hypothetical protein